VTFRPLVATLAAAMAISFPLPLLAQAAPFDSLTFGALTWRSLGPQRGGRSVAVAGTPARTGEYYMGTTGGGVFKTTDGGETWAPVSDRYFGGTIGAIAVADANPDIVYVGGGEYPIRGNVSHGDGVYKSPNGGRTWDYVGLVETRHIAKIRIHPSNPDIVYVAALGPVFAPSPARGVYKSTNGGRTWSRILFRNDSTGAIDLVMDPSDPNTLYAGLWQAGRTPWQLVSGGAGSGLFKSTDAGATWTELTRNPGLPTGLIGNVGLAVSPANPRRVWAIIEADEGGVFRSDDGGATWTRLNDERKLRQRAWYYTRIFADTRNENAVYVLNVQFWKSTDGGRTFDQQLRAHHGDYHDLWIAPNDPNRMIVGDDGGGEVSIDGGRIWTDIDYPTAQFYHVTTTNHFPYHVCGAQQDNSTACVPSRPVSGSHLAEYYDAGGGESGYIAVRPDQPDIMYAGSYGGLLTRKDVRTGVERNVSPWPLNPMGHSAGDLRYRFQWTFPIVVSPHDPNVVYAGANVLFRSADEGSSWTAISPDLTRRDPRTLGPSGGPITKDQTSVEYYGTIFTLAESPLEKGVIWTGSDDGLVHVTRDNGATWTNVTPADLPEWTRVSIVEASSHAKGTAYLAGNRYQLNDFAPYLYRTSDYGKTWTRITTGIAPAEFTRVIREDPVRAGLLYAGTERGVWISFDDGGRWQRLQRNLPPVPVHDLAVKEGDLVAGTHGRGFWVLDDLSALRELTPALPGEDVRLFAPRPAYQIASFGSGWDGVGVQYWLKKGGQRVTLEFLDAGNMVLRAFTSEPDPAVRADSMAGAVIRARTDAAHERARDSLANLGVMPAAMAGPATVLAARPEGWRYTAPPRVPNRAGMNRFTWNLRMPDAAGFTGMIMWAGGLTGPMVPPGTYRVRLTVGDPGTSQVEEFTVLKDPRVNASPADLEAQYKLLLEIRDWTSEANNAVRAIRNIRGQLAQRTAQIPAGRRAALDRAGAALTAQLGPVEEALYQVRNRSGQDPLNYPIRLNNQIAALGGVVMGAQGRPTQQSYEVFTVLSEALAVETGRLKSALDAPLTAVNRELERLRLPAIVPATTELKPED
jgi:photosystem II stability/assembly factor-like uncharacterized protein